MVMLISIGSKFKALFVLLSGKPFWIWDVEDHRLEDARTSGKCCFNHIIGLPRKNGLEMPIFDYEKMIFDSLHSTKHLWIKKATGLGITEFMLRYMAWLCFSGSNGSVVKKLYSGSAASSANVQKIHPIAGSKMCIVTGPRIELAITLIDRMKGLFRNLPRISGEPLTFNTKETRLL